jgi:hypothetical protein
MSCKSDVLLEAVPPQPRVAGDPNASGLIDTHGPAATLKVAVIAKDLVDLQVIGHRKSLFE